MGNPKPLHDKESFLELKERFDTDTEIAEYLSVSNPTVVYWKKKHIGKEQSECSGVYYRENKQDGHFQIHIRNGPVISEHALSALANGADPYRVFDNDTHVHHKNKCSYDNRPENVMVVDSKFHQKIHQNENWARERGYLTLE
jgi:hypothetical protein